MPDGVEFEGFDEFRRALKKIEDPEKTRAYKVASAEVADLVIAAAKDKASTRMERRAAATLVPVLSAAGGAVRLGGGFEGAFGAEFGADRNQRRQGRPHGTPAVVAGWNQFKPWRGSDTGAGYFLYPSIREQEDEIVNRYDEMFRKLFDEDGGE